MNDKDDVDLIALFGLRQEEVGGPNAPQSDSMPEAPGDSSPAAPAEARLGMSQMKREAQPVLDKSTPVQRRLQAQRPTSALDPQEGPDSGSTEDAAPPNRNAADGGQSGQTMARRLMRFTRLASLSKPKDTTRPLHGFASEPGSGADLAAPETTIASRLQRLDSFTPPSPTTERARPANPLKNRLSADSQLDAQPVELEQPLSFFRKQGDTPSSSLTPPSLMPVSPSTHAPITRSSKDAVEDLAQEDTALMALFDTEEAEAPQLGSPSRTGKEGAVADVPMVLDDIDGAADAVDVAALFGLSPEEVRGLGLTAAAQPRGQDDNVPAGPRLAGDEDKNLMALFDEGDDGRRPMSTSAAVTQSSPDSSSETPVSPSLMTPHTGAQGSGDTPADENEFDVALLFGLSSEEARGLGLAFAESSATSPESTEQEKTEDASLHPVAFKTMRDITTAAPKADKTSTDIWPQRPLATPWPASSIDDRELTGAGAMPIKAEMSAEEEPAWAAPVASSLSSMGTTDRKASDDETATPMQPAIIPPASSPTPAVVSTTRAVTGPRQQLDPDLLSAFAEESTELLDGLHVELERLEQDANDRDALLETRRSVHTIKGGAKMCGFESIVLLTHSSENLLDLIASGTALLDRAALDAFFACEPLLRRTISDAIQSDVSAEDAHALADLTATFDALCAPYESLEQQEGDTNGEALLAVASSDLASPIAVVGDTALATTGADGTHDLPETRAEARAAASVVPSSWLEADAMPLTREPTTARATTSTALGAGPTPSATDVKGLPAAPTEALRGAALVQSDERAAVSRRGTTSINVDLPKVEAVVAKVSELAANRASSQGMIDQLMETAEEARRNAARLQAAVAQLSDEIAAITPVDTNEPESETYNTLNSLSLLVQESALDQQALVQRIHHTITMHWQLRTVESRANAEIQSALMSIRLIPIASMRVRLDAVVRQAAQATGKSVRWQLQGGHVSVEKNVFDRLFEPLMHLLRNSVDHGLESRAGRLSAGKSEIGLITVTAEQEGNQIIISVGDDGGGIDSERIAVAATARGLAEPAQVAAMSPQQKMNLIFTPGFSTAASVSHLSGRGVGMDAVREACLRMGGAVTVSSTIGFGVVTTMRLPLSLSVTRGLIVRDSGCLLAIPAAQISTLHLVKASDIVTTPRGRVVRVEGRQLPLYMLPMEGRQQSSSVQDGEVNVLQASFDGRAVGIIVDDVLDEEEILIKAPPILLRSLDTLLGAYMMPNGVVAPVINLPQMLSGLRPMAPAPDVQADESSRTPTVLVVDDSMSMRAALTGTLHNVGFRVLTARDGQEALDMLKREGLPTMITLDIEMPRMDGLETLFAIRQLPGARVLPIFMITSRGGAKHRRAAEQLGATRYFAKPYRDSELADAANQVYEDAGAWEPLA